MRRRRRRTLPGLPGESTRLRLDRRGPDARVTHVADGAPWTRAGRTGRSRSGHAEGFPSAAFEHLAGLEDRHFWFRSRNRLIVWALRRYFPHASRILEVGTGAGAVLKELRQRLPAVELVGTDVSTEALGIARTRVPGAHFVELDLRSLELENEFDVVCAFDVLEHVDGDDDALARLFGAARIGGGLLITVPQYQWLWSKADDYGRHRRRYTKREIESKVEQAGFRVMRSTAWVCTLLPVVALSRLSEGLRRGPYDPRRELQLPSPINRSFELMLDAERLAIQRGLTLPFGSSRLIVAEKR
jgi:SAM-dependent methyltransferase